MNEPPPHTIIDVIRDYWGLFSTLVFFGLGVIWWYIRRLVQKQDEVQSERHDATRTMLNQHNERIATLERETMTRKEFEDFSRDLRKDINDGFRKLTDRLDRYYDQHK